MPFAASYGQTAIIRVLVVEDEVRLAEAIAHGLRVEGFDVDVAHTGPDGRLWRAVEGVYSAIVLDILLPGLNGYALCRQLCADGNRTPVLMLTSNQGEHDEAERWSSAPTTSCASRSASSCSSPPAGADSPVNEHADGVLAVGDLPRRSAEAALLTGRARSADGA